MKRYLAAFAGLMLAASVASAGAGNMYFGIGAGVDVPVSPSGGTVGIGGDVILGYAFDKNVAVQLDIDNFVVSSNGASTYELRPLAEVKYTFDAQNFKPYLLGGLGMSVVFLPSSGLSGSASTASNFDAVMGVGAQFDLGGGTDLFIQAKSNFVFATGTTGVDLPLELGLIFPL